MFAVGSRGVRAAGVWALIALACAGAASGAPRPDPPPLPPPPPAPQPPPQPPPPAPQPPPPPQLQPPPAVAVAPPAPSATELVARRRAAAARVRAARIKAQRAQIKAGRTRAARIASLKRAHLRELATAQVGQPRETAGFASPASAAAKVTPILLAGLLGAVFLLGVALMPARAVPWLRAARALDDRRAEIGVLAAAGLFATGVLFVFITFIAA